MITWRYATRTHTSSAGGSKVRQYRSSQEEIGRASSAAIVMHSAVTPQWILQPLPYAADPPSAGGERPVQTILRETEQCQQIVRTL